METKSEDLHLHAFDKFVANAVIKTGYGFGIGLLCAILIKRRWFPIHLGTGSGLGFALSDYNKQLKEIK
jgi:inner membrane organizing system protein 1